MSHQYPVSLIDLHMHSLASDGTMTPTDLVRRVHAAGVRVMALTDHDNTAGLEEARVQATALDIQLVPGVEVSSEWNTQGIHIVGLFIDPKNNILQGGLSRIMAFRDWRALEIGRLLEDAGISDAEAGARAMAGSRMVGRSHFARWLVREGHCADANEAFGKYLGRGCKAYVPSDWISMPEAIGWINAAGGSAVLAHPGRYKLSGARLRALLTEFREAGGIGLEVCSGSQVAGDREHLGCLARQLGMAGSVGSDFHGPNFGHAAIGHLPPLPDGVEPVWDRAGIHLH
ncbi:PHP domain-containing protein [Acidithiobacillus ferriphilus]|uniref:PHP domain-containing protein n=1 Tax=Acidithiobacillus ferriphilus TaxID=1689834 RepID=UPI001C068250|nr:PHP domain-containing protein [Acidithiobacillus ferriphilus]MBU2847465.1 PHP domain-containing protein [Acidithiobacillus ferriphilus]MEB8534898.1 PHP domain-containing protein [Acidithiobacillus ferriphilus]